MNQDELTMNEALENLEPINIDSYELSLYSYDDMIALAGDIEITKYKSADVKTAESKYSDTKKMTEFGAINDVRMGTMSLTDKCVTCAGFNCPGHWGIINFGKDNEIMNPQYVRIVIMVLNCVCHDCSRLLFAKELENGGLHMTSQLSQILKKSPEQRLALLEKYCDKIEKCTMDYPKEMNIKKCKKHFKLKETDVKSDGIIRYYKAEKESKKSKKISKEEQDKQGLTPFHINKIINILKHITDEDAKLLGFIGETKPIDLIMHGILVMPPLARPPTTNKKGETIHNPFTTMYLDILKAINNKYNAPGKIFEAVRKLTVKNDTQTGSSQKMKSIGESMLGKKGIFRLMTLGKRGDFCARSVAGAGHSLSLNEMELPDYWASILTKNLKVTSFNIDALTELLKAGRITHITNIAGFRKPVDPTNKILTLSVGQTVDIMKEPGDRVFANRQPSLSKLSMMSFKVVLGNSLVIRSHLSITTPLNLDYDGDELNVWNPRNFEVLSELTYILDVVNCIISTESGKPSMALNINSKTAGYLQSHPDVEIEEPLYHDMIQSLLNKDSLPTLYERMENLGFTPFRINENGVKMYSGRTALSALFPVDFEYENKDIKIYKGILLTGVLASAQLGTSARSIVDELAKFYSKERAADFLTDAPHMLNIWIVARGFTVGQKDCVNMVTDYKCELYNKKYNKRVQLFEHEYHKLQNVVFKQKQFGDLQDLLQIINEIITQTVNHSLDIDFNKQINNEFQSLINITNLLHPVRCKKNVNTQPLFVLLRQLSQNKNTFKNTITTILDNMTNVFKMINNKVSDADYRILKLITHQLEAMFIVSGTQVDLDYFYDKMIIDNVKLNDIDAYIVTIFNLVKDVNHDIQLTYVVNVLFDFYTNYVHQLKEDINNIIKIVKELNHCQSIKNVIENTIILLFNEQSLIITSQLYNNMKKELGKEYNKNILIKNEELLKIKLDIEALGSKKDIDYNQLAHHERLITEKTDVVKAIGAKIVKSDLTNSIIMQTEAGAGTKGSLVNVGQIGGAVGQQYVKGQRLWHQFPRLSSHFDEDDESPKARGLIESSFTEGLTPTELFQLQAGSKLNVIETGMLTPLVGKLQRLLARSLENIVIAGDGSIRNANGLMYASSYNAGFDIAKTIKVGSVNHFVDVHRQINILNHQQGWYTKKELKETKIKPKKPVVISLEDQLQILLQQKTISLVITSPEVKQRKLTIYEKARIIGVRAEMLNNNEPPRVPIGNLIDPLKIAELEYQAGKLAEEPALFIQRRIPGQKEPINVYPTLDMI